ncbi:MAG: hypothetical protein KAS53_03750 [Candidatus Cloacimonetes bacterium]|nr:hypothetical protein [Candidatus Cloacimonadota bacterium]
MYIFFFIFSIIFISVVILILILQKQNLKNVDEKYYELKFQIRILSFSLVLASVLLGFLSWNVKKDAVKELKMEIFKEFDSVLNFYVVEHTVTTSTEDTLRINFSDLKRTNNENLPKFYKSPLMFVSAENAVFSVIRITKNYVTIRLIPEGKYRIDAGHYDYNGKITLWFVEK